MHTYNAIFNKTVSKLVTVLTKYLFPYLNHTSYLNISQKNYLNILLHREFAAENRKRNH